MDTNVKIKAEITDKKDLTKSEAQVLKLLCEEKTPDEVAEGLYRSIRTIETHIANIRHKLGSKTISGAMLRALARKMVRIEMLLVYLTLSTLVTGMVSGRPVTRLRMPRPMVRVVKTNVGRFA